MGDRGRVSWIGWKDAAEVALSARAAKHLIVSRKKFYLAKRRDAQLHARTAHLLCSNADPFFNNSTSSAKPRCVFIEADFAELESHRSHTVEDGGITRLVQIRQIDRRVSFARDTLVQLHYRLFHRGSLSIVRREQSKPTHGVTWDHARKQIQIIFDHARVDRLGGHINHPRAGLSKQQQQEKKPFFVALCLETRYCYVD